MASDPKVSSVFSLLIVIFLLVGCSSANIAKTAAADKQASTAIPAPLIPQPASSEIYLMLSSKSPPIAYTIAHMPVSCLLVSAPCQDFESAAAFPNYPFVPGFGFHWLPDASYFLLYNGYDSALLSVDASTFEARQISIPFSVISDDLPWSPNGDWIAASTQDLADPYNSHIILVNPLTSNYNFLELPAALNGTLFPLGWVSENDVLLLQNKYDYPDGDSSQKKVVVEQNLGVLDITDLTFKTILSPKLRGDSWPQVSPDGNAVVVTTAANEKSDLEIYLVDGVLLQSFGDYMNPVWAPDGSEIAAISQDEDGFSVFILDPASGEQRKLFHLSEQPELTWFPDGTGLIIRTWITDEQGQDHTTLYLVSLAGEVQEIDINKVINRDLLVVGISFQPASSQ